MRLLIFLAVGVFVASAERPKLKDATGAKLVLLGDIGEGCGSDTQHGYGIVNGSLEKCDQYLQTDPAKQIAYEQFKCRSLRFKGQMVGNKCQCLPRWSGPICHNYNGCPPGHALYNAVCTPNACQKDGQMAVGSKQIECTCPIPWDGRHCERLACWRKTSLGFERRFRNSGQVCTCGEHYKGDNCDIVKSCMRGEFDGTKCNCPEEWHGEICDKKKKCTKQVEGTLVCSASGSAVSIFVFTLAYMFKW